MPNGGRHSGRIAVPKGDGSGEMKEVVPDHVHEGKTFEGQEERFTKHRENEAWERIGKAAQDFNKYHQAYATDHNLSPEELVAATYLENLNMRYFYPEDLGGPDHYDTLCKSVWEWFEENKDKP